MATGVLRRAVETVVLFRLSPPAGVKASASVDGSDNKKTRHKLKKFLTRRPTLQAVRDKGYIKGERLPAAPALHSGVLVLHCLSLNSRGVCHHEKWMFWVFSVVEKLLFSLRDVFRLECRLHLI